MSAGNTEPRDYIGTKRITAWPQKNDGPAPMGGGEGYAVRYADGYTSWSPKNAFEEAYRPVDRLDFSAALWAAKRGAKIRLPEWTEDCFLFTDYGVLKYQGQNVVESFFDPRVVMREDWQIVE